MVENKTKATDADVGEFINAVEHPMRKADGQTLRAMMTEVTGEKAVMWGENIVGFGQYQYQYANGDYGDWPRIGFSPRKAKLSLYGLTNAITAPELLAQLGKHKLGKGCLYINKLEDIDLAVLRELMVAAWANAPSRG